MVSPCDERKVKNHTRFTACTEFSYDHVDPYSAALSFPAFGQLNP